ncbi:MAG: hypothetical protein HY348_02450 [Nitrospira defluvii]|nr:hypothetical protein [Nitrospira defluvii]
MATLRTVRIAPATKEYLREEEGKDPLLKKVVTGLIWRLEREAEPVGYRLPGYNPPTFLLKLPYRLPIPRILRVVYEDHEDEFFIVLAEVEKLSQVDEG